MRPSCSWLPACLWAWPDLISNRCPVRWSTISIMSTLLGRWRFCFFMPSNFASECLNVFHILLHLLTSVRSQLPQCRLQLCPKTLRHDAQRTKTASHVSLAHILYTCILLFCVLCPLITNVYVVRGTTQTSWAKLSHYIKRSKVYGHNAVVCCSIT